MKSLIEQLGEEWYEKLKDEFKKPYIRKLQYLVQNHRKAYTVYPEPKNVFRAYRLTPYSQVKVVIIGQDPYPHEHANGLAFSANESLDKTPPSLENIFKELEEDIGFSLLHEVDLTRWAHQGVFLLNSTLTVQAYKPGSHSSFGWERFTDRTVQLLCERKEPIVFILWGNHAQRKAKNIPSRHPIIVSPHPSPLSAYRGFFGSRPFSRTNNYLEKLNQKPIDWFKQNIKIT